MGNGVHATGKLCKPAVSRQKKRFAREMILQNSGFVRGPLFLRYYRRLVQTEGGFSDRDGIILFPKVGASHDSAENPDCSKTFRIFFMNGMAFFFDHHLMQKEFSSENFSS